MLRPPAPDAQLQGGIAARLFNVPPGAQLSCYLIVGGAQPWLGRWGSTAEALQLLGGCSLTSSPRIGGVIVLDSLSLPRKH